MPQKSKATTQKIWDNEHGPFLSYWRLLFITDEGYGHGVESTEKRTSLVEVDLLNLLQGNRKEELRMILETFPNTNLYLTLPKGKDPLFAFFVSIVLKRGMNQQQTIDYVYEGSRPASLDDAEQGEILWQKEKIRKSKELKKTESRDSSKSESIQ